jgi:hypothetical protein
MTESTGLDPIHSGKGRTMSEHDFQATIAERFFGVRFNAIAFWGFAMFDFKGRFAWKVGENDCAARNLAAAWLREWLGIAALLKPAIKERGARCYEI